MVKIEDMITGEIIICPNDKAEEIAKNRVFNHNLEWWETHKGNRWSQKAYYIKYPNGNIIIERKK